MVKPALIPIDAIQSRILLIRGQRVMMDYDLAALYGVALRVTTPAHRSPLFTLNLEPGTLNLEPVSQCSQAYFWMVA